MELTGVYLWSTHASTRRPTITLTLSHVHHVTCDKQSKVEKISIKTKIINQESKTK